MDPSKYLTQLKAKNTASALDLQYAFEKTISKKYREKSGAFYTPLTVVNRLIQSAFKAHFASSSEIPTILDPACGTGLFLTQALKILLEKFPDKEAAALTACLVGIDLNKEALEVTKLAFALTIEEQRPNIELSSLQSALAALRLVNTDALHDLPFSNFDIVIGNPPYGLARGEKLSASENLYLRTRYQQFLTGRVNKYLLFIARSMELLKNGGSLSFIVPNSWLGIREAGALRTYLLKQGAIQEIVYYNFPVFEDPGVEAVRLLARKAAMLPSFSVSVTENAEESRISSKATLISEEILNSPDAIIPIFVSAESLAVLQTLRSHNLRLDHPDSPFQALIALQAYATGKGSPPQTTQMVQVHTFHAQKKINSTYIPYLAGRDVERYRASWSGEYLSLGPWLAENPPLNRYLGPRVLIREVLGTPLRALKATYTDQPYLYNRSVLHVRSKSDNADQLLALLLLLNSMLGSFLIKLAGKKSQRKLFPKVVLDDLKALPISSTLIAEPATAAKLARQLLNQGSSAELDAAADQLIFDYYKLTTLQRESVRIALETAI